ncbi:IQ domain-containing protein K-like [Pomacea canaliculata]|uniref:IQ domain-containing protein K-like n=1 Tax=Pomacea canaliculata TaxID=400727 RepID=UPI000D738187|nr:IQ domain-containing protein K-like [Pomacea canaliculata]
MSVLTQVSKPNDLWNDICKEFQSRRPSYDDDAASVSTDYEDFDPAKHTPVFYGQMHAKVTVDFDVAAEVDPAISHPSCIGYAFCQKPSTTKPPQSQPAPPKDTCPPRVYLEHYVFPYILPALEETLKTAKEERCFQRKWVKFNALDFMSEYLYRKNPNFTGREETKLMEIPFVKEWLKDNPRPPLPLSLVWTEDEAALVIQSRWRGYQVRKTPEVQELWQWQREWREINRNIQSCVNDFWESKMPEKGDTTSPELEEKSE